MKIQVKCFLKPHPDYDYSYIEDSLSINVKNQRFAIADGMTESYLSGIFANLLVKQYTDEMSYFYTDDKTCVAPNLCLDWKRKAESMELSVKGSIDEPRLLRKKRIYPFAASTFAGISVNNNNSIDYTVIGDSCVFVLDKNFSLQTVVPRVDITGFTNTPSYICSDGKIIGNIYNGTIKLSDGYIFLMTDAIANWFVNNLADNPQIVSQIWNLSSHTEMISLLDNEYQSRRLKPDDIAVIALKFSCENTCDILWDDTKSNNGNHLENWLTQRDINANNIYIESQNVNINSLSCQGSQCEHAENSPIGESEEVNKAEPDKECCMNENSGKENELSDSAININSSSDVLIEGKYTNNIEYNNGDNNIIDNDSINKTEKDENAHLEMSCLSIPHHSCWKSLKHKLEVLYGKRN